MEGLGGTECAGATRGPAVLEFRSVGLRAAEADGKAELGGESGLGVEGEIGFAGGVGVHDLDMVRLVAGHHLVAGHAVSDRMHDRPLDGGLLPAAFGFGGGERDDLGSAQIHLEATVLDEDAAPDNLARLRDAADRAAAEPEVHRGLSQRVGALVSADLMGGRIQANFVPPAFQLPQIRDGKLQVLATSAAEPMRSPLEVPTVASAAGAASGLSGYEYATWYGFLAPARTPAPVMELLARSIREAADEPEVRERYQTLGLSSRIRTLRDFDDYLRADMERLVPLARESGAKAN